MLLSEIISTFRSLLVSSFHAYLRFRDDVLRPDGIAYMMSQIPGKALYADDNGQFSVRANIDTEGPEDGELVVGTLYSGVNPADIKHSTHLGIRSTIIGYDFCGKVVSASPSSKLSLGDVVAGYTPSSLGRRKKYGTHQARIVCPESMAFKVPSNLPQSHAAALTVVAMTAADAIFNKFRMPLPSSKPNDIQEPILIWGASSSVGLCAVQFAKASGCRNIFVTASPGRHEVLKSLGATQCFDYSNANVTANIVAAVEQLGQGPIRYAFDAVGSMATPSSADLMAKCLTDERASLLSVVLRQDKRFGMPVALTKDEWVIQPPGAPQPIRLPSRPDDHWHAWKALQWAVDNYGSRFNMPRVEVFEGTAEDALAEMYKVADGGRGFGKLVLQHPLG